jgi:hypothetical protein
MLQKQSNADDFYKNQAQNKATKYSCFFHNYLLAKILSLFAHPKLVKFLIHQN